MGFYYVSSAGIGRAAVFVALDIVMNRANQNNIVSIHECVEKLRSERVQMVQLEVTKLLLKF